MKKTLTLTLAALLTVAIVLTVAFACSRQEQADDTPHYSTQKATDDFTDLYKLADRNGNSLAIVTVTAIEQVTDIIEKYDVIDTLYTKVTATVERDYSGYIEQESITILILGNTANFPSRETPVVGRTYLLRLESWVHESGMVWLVSPFESTHLRVHDDGNSVHESASDLNYKKSLSPDEFGEKYADYRAQNPVSPTALSDHYADILSTIQSYDYADKEMDYHLTDDAITARKTLAEQLINN